MFGLKVFTGTVFYMWGGFVALVCWRTYRHAVGVLGFGVEAVLLSERVRSHVGYMKINKMSI